MEVLNLFFIGKVEKCLSGLYVSQNYDQYINTRLFCHVYHRGRRSYINERITYTFDRCF